MKRCPKCNRQYKDDTLRFCLEDGAPLSAVTRDSPAPPTEILPVAPPTQKSSTPTIPSYSSDSVRTVTQERQSNPILTAGVVAIALLLLVLVGIVAYFVIKQSGSTNSAQANQAVSPTPNTKAAKQTSDEREDFSPTPPPNAPPLKIMASASSVRLAVQANTYYASNAIDGKRSTAWIEGVDGPGIGEWIRFDFDREINLHRILIQPGYFKSPQIWSENNRLAKVTAEFSDGSSRDLNFPNLMESQKIDVGPVRTRWVRIVIKATYPGTNPGPSDDTALSEIAFEWEP